MWPQRLRVFVSYRRADSEASAGRVADALARQFGARRVFLDTASMPLGPEYMRVLDTELARADIVVVIIGKSWASISNERGLRLQQEDDPVRFEVDHALRGGKKIVPVLIDDAPIPSREALPEDLRGLCDFTAQWVRNASFATDFDALVDGMLGRPRGQLRTERDRLLAWIASAWGSALLVPAVAIVAALGAWTGAFDVLAIDTRVQRALLPLVPQGDTDVMVAAIDADTERLLGREWGRDPEAWRRGHAEFIDAASASGARAVLFDLAFDCQSDPACGPEPFAAIAAAAQRAAQRVPPMDVVFGVRSRDGARPALAAPLRDVGRRAHICIFDRGAGALFSVPTAVLRGDPGATALVEADTPALSVAAVASAPLRTVDVERRALGFDGLPRDPPLAFSTIERRRDRGATCSLIAYGDLTATLAFAPSAAGRWNDASRRVSYGDVVRSSGDAAARWRGRALIVGVTSVGRAESNRDRLAVLDGAFGSRVVYGVELHADAAAALASGHVPSMPTVGAQTFTAAVMGVLGALLAVVGTAWRWPVRVVALALPIGAWICLCVLLAQHGQLMNPAYDVAALLLVHAALAAAQVAARRYLYGGPTK